MAETDPVTGDGAEHYEERRRPGIMSQEKVFFSDPGYGGLALMGQARDLHFYFPMADWKGFDSVIIKHHNP